MVVAITAVKRPMATISIHDERMTRSRSTKKSFRVTLSYIVEVDLFINIANN
jgi:hypothetical protein